MDNGLEDLYEEIILQGKKENVDELKIKKMIALLKDIIKNGDMEREELISRFNQIGGK
jgi:hypothetical protein